jgi:KDO2-lipid IV(A) lauroyltransferase
MYRILKHIRFILEAIPAWLFYIILRFIPIDLASAFCGKLMELIGPHLKASRVARRNLKMCYPEKSDAEIEIIMKRMWNNLGRVIGESPSIIYLSNREFKRRVKVTKSFKEFKEPGIFVSGHFGNFELSAKISIELKLGLNLVYRPANNIYINRLIRLLRERRGNRLIPKGKAGLLQILKVLDNKGNLGMLVDQRMNDGIDCTFFGKLAKTTSLPAKLAIKYRIPIYVSCIKREKGCRFHLYIKELKPGKDDDPAAVTQEINDIIETWVRETPEQWFWVHKRWG